MRVTEPDFRLAARGPYSLAASTRFLEGFAPAAFEAVGDRPLDLAFPVEGTWRTVGVRVRPTEEGVAGQIIAPAALDSADIGADTAGLGAADLDTADIGAAEVEAVRTQLERILSLDVDGSQFAAVGERDEVVAGLQRRYPGLRPVGFWSAYEAAAWAIIGQRTRIRQAAVVKARMAEELGVGVDFGDRVLHAFPAPERLAEVTSFRGLSGHKPAWLRSLATAALDGRLDAARLRALPRGEALAELKQLPGIGDFSAELVLLRGAGDPDSVPRHEPRLARAVALAYGLDGPAATVELDEISAGWGPYRTWVTLLLRTWLEDETGEIAGRRPPGSPPGPT